ncbi:nitrite reductase [Candidatus Marinarcus aquaticus]|uniref:Nitrite reductase n=1 Tax=Candidatus Marinarcus aquaticus TaxID=2044504 RepID=A0A4V1LNY1_9BACT|nr:nitrite reductase [Candidatus Marinarcus aquaticus]RXJ57600.1 nitrite reductase [Candidatus Marinarcus aquaticus]
MKLSKILSIATIACIGFVSQATAGEIKLSDAEMKKATQVYFDRCAGCHGMLRKGALGPSLEASKSKEMGTETLKYIINNGTPGGMPGWGKTGELTAAETELMAKYIQIKAPQPPEKSMADMKKTHKILVPVKDRPKSPEAKNWKDYFAVILRDVGKIAIVDGVTKDVVSVVPSGFATHITRTGASGRYMYVIGRDGKASMIDLWMKEPKNVAEIRTCNDARAIDTSKHPDYKDKYAIVGCYWPPSIVTLEADTLEPLKIVSTASYTYDENVFTREARVAAIIASHDKPEWVVNIKETGQVWLYDYSNVMNPKITMVEAERFLHDGGWDLSKRYFMTAANAKNIISVIDTKEGKLVANIPSQGNKPHPGRGVNVDHPKYGPIWGSGHIGSNDIIFIGTDPEKHPKNAWKVVKKIALPGEGGGNLFVKGHPNSQYIFADRPVNPNRELQTQIYVIDRDSLEVVKTIKIPKKYLKSGMTEDGKEVKARGPVHFEFNADGSEVWTSIWGNKLQASPILVFDTKTLKLKNVIDDKRLITPTGKFNVTNTMTDTY